MKRTKADTRANVIMCLLMLVFLLVSDSIVIAEPLMPLYENQAFTFHRRDAIDSVGWSWLMATMGPKVTLGSHDYFDTQSLNYNNDSKFVDGGYLRSTEQAVYIYNPTGDDRVWFQKQPVGAKWSFPHEYKAYHYEVHEVVGMESVTVPYATFDQAYKYRVYYCYDPGNLGLGKSPDSYEWVVPGIGVVREEDYDADYPPVVQELTGMSMAPVYRFYNKLNGKHFYTINPTEKANVLAMWPWVFDFEGIKYYTPAEGGKPGTLPVYRLYSAALSTHVYTMSETEKNKLITDPRFQPFWTLEGVAFYAWPPGSQLADTKPVYRFWSDTFGSHVYTMSTAERDKLLVTPASWFWTYEGIAWYDYE